MTAETNSFTDELHSFRYFAEKITKEGKAKCGDSYSVQMLEDEGILILAVADGVSSCPCDWKASSTACEAAINEFAGNDGSIAVRLFAAAARSHASVQQIGDHCRGSISSLTLVVWETDKDEIHYVNIGDSRIYVGSEQQLEQITNDDVVKVLVKRSGEVILNAGVPVFMRGVTRSVGQKDPLSFEVRTHPFVDTDLMILVTDGVSKNEAFTSDFPSIFGSGQIDRRLSQLVRESSDRNDDDATLVVVWRGDVSARSRPIYEECVASGADFRRRGLSVLHVTDYLEQDLFNELRRGSNRDIYRLLAYSADFGIRFERSVLSEVLSVVIKQGTDRGLVTLLRDLIRTSFV